MVLKAAVRVAHSQHRGHPVHWGWLPAIIYCYSLRQPGRQSAVSRALCTSVQHNGASAGAEEALPCVRTPFF